MNFLNKKEDIKDLTLLENIFWGLKKIVFKVKELVDESIEKEKSEFIQFMKKGYYHSLYEAKREIDDEFLELCELLNSKEEFIIDEKMKKRLNNSTRQTKNRIISGLVSKWEESKISEIEKKIYLFKRLITLKKIKICNYKEEVPQSFLDYVEEKLRVIEELSKMKIKELLNK